MVMKHEDHEALLNELLTPELEHSRRTEILQALRVDYSTVRADQESLTTKNTKLTNDNADLIVSNSKLFRQIGITGTEEEKKQEQKTFSETVNLDQIERGIQ